MRKVIKFCSILCAASLIIPTASATLIDSDLTIEGNVLFDITSDAVIGNANQSADMSQIIGGISTSSSVNDVTPSGANPVGGVLTHYGDGVGVNAIAASTASTESTAGAFIFDFSFSLLNNSLTDTHKVFFELDFSNIANADGTDAYIDSEINLFDSLNNELFFSDLTSDSSFGDEKNGVDQGSFGATLLDSGKFLFDVTLAAGAANSFSAVLKMDGEDFTNDSFFAGSSNAFIKVLSSENQTSTTPPPTPVPEPTTLLLFATVLMLMEIKRHTKS